MIASPQIKDISKALAIIVILTLFFSIFLAHTTSKMNADHGRHYYKAKEQCKTDDPEKFFAERGWTVEDCENYSPLFHWLAAPFTYQEKTFNQFAIFLVVVVTPLVLVLISRHWISAWLFFSTTHYLYFFVDGAYPQALANILAMAILIEKNWKWDLLLALLASLAHGYGFLFALIVLSAKYVNKARLEKIWLGCSGVFGSAETPQILKTKVQEVTGIVATNTGNPMVIKDILFFPIITFPIMYIYWAIKKAWQVGRFDLIIIAAVAIFAGFTDSTRIFYVVPLALIPALSWFYKDLSTRQKHLFLLLTLANFIFLIYTFVNLKLCNGWPIFPF